MKKQLDIKKLLILNLPYILMGLFATNFGEGWRRAQGADASAKMLSFFSTLPVALASWWPSLHPLDLLVGLCCAVGGALFAACLRALRRAWRRRAKARPFALVAVGGLAFAGIVLACGWQAFQGTGMGLLRGALAGSAAPADFAVKAGLTVLVLGFGFKGGEIMPMFSIGALLGCSLGLATGAPAGFSAALGMAAFFAAAGRCPLTALLMGAEIFGWASLPFLLIAVAAAYAGSYDVGVFGRGAASELARVRRRARRDVARGGSMRMRENERQPRRRVYAKPVKRRAPRRFEALGARRSGTMWGMETLKKLKQKAGSRETEPSAGAAPAQGAASSTAPDASPVSARQVLASYYRPYTFLFVFDLVCATVLACVDLAFPQFLSFFTKDFFQSSPEAIIGSLWWIALLFVVLYGVRTACQYFITSWGHIMGARMEADMRMDLFKQYQRLSFSYYDRNNTGEMMSKLVTDLFDISELAHHGPENLFICILKIVGSFALLFLINVPLTAIMLVATLLLAAYSFWRNYQKRVIFTENRKKMADINARLQDSLGGIRVVKSFGNEPVEIKKFDRTNARFVATKESSYRFMGSFHAVNSLFIGVLYTVTIVGGGYFVATGGLAVSDLAIYALYIGIFISPIEQLINFVETFQKGYAGFRRFMEVLAVRPDIADAPDAVDLGAAERARCGGPDGHVAGEVRYRDVHFSYDGVHEVLRGLDLAIPAGATVALVGPSGGGKTTTCSLLPRFYDPERGSVEIDGIDIRAVTVESLRDAIGIVQQDVYLFGGTIRDNIAYGRPDATTAEIVEAAKRANIDAFVRGLSDGYDTYVGERGARLSGGQKQRIAIARVFLKDPRILILDEATSALDNESERAIQKSLEELSAGRTTLVIAHRLSTIRGADLIAVVEDGRVAERGTHEQLLALGGTYAHYYEMQFGPVEQGAVL